MEIVMSKSSYVSPFPRKRDNEEFLRNFSKGITPAIVSDKSDIKKIQAPHEGTKSYMARNPFYFELQERKLSKITKEKQQKNIKLKAPLMSKSGLIIENRKLQSLLSIYNLNMGKCLGLSQSDTKHELNVKNKTKSEQGNATKIVGSGYKTEENPRRRNSKNLKEKNIKAGVVPEYIKEFKIRGIIEKEYERLIEEERLYPKGTVKISEDDRLHLLHKVIEKRENLLAELRKLPVSSHVRSIKIQNFKRDLENKLEKVEYVMRILQRNEVYLKK